MKIIIYGAGDFARLMRIYFDTDSCYEVEAFCVDKDFLKSNVEDGLPVVSFDDVETLYPPDQYSIFVAAGYRNMRARKKMYLNARSKKYEFVNYISSSAKTYKTNLIGSNVVILAGVILEPFAEIGNNVFLNTGVIVCHHAKIYDHCFFAARSMVGGFTKVFENSFIGFAATILQKLVLAQETLLGAGAVLTHNTCEHSRYIGVPAIQSGTHEATGICIAD